MNGSEFPICLRVSGCQDPVGPYLKKLTPLEQIAIEAFRLSQTQWEISSGMSGGGRTGLRYESVRVVVQSLGCDLSSDLLNLIQQCESLLLTQEAARREAEAS